MSKKDFLIRKLEGQIEEFDDEINKLICEVRDTSEKDVKSECEKKISALQMRRSNAMDEIIKLKKTEI